MTQTKLYLLTGSGGVGKTTLSAAWALALAEQDQRVALITIDPAKRLAQSLGLDALNDNLSPTKIHPKLWAMMLDQRATSERLVLTYASSRESAENILKNRYYQAFSRSLAGVQEMMAIHEVHQALSCGEYDAVVLDTPPAQHALDLLDVPERLRSALDSSALRWLLDDQAQTHDHFKSKVDPRSGGGIRASLSGLSRTVALKAFTKITAGQFLEDLLDFLRLFSDVLRRITTSGQTLERALRGENAEIWVVSSAHAAPLRAAAMVSDQLEARAYRVNTWLINRAPIGLCGDLPAMVLHSASEQIRESLGHDAELHALVLSLVQQEIDRAKDAAQLLKNYEETRRLFLISERLDDHTPLSIVRSLSEELLNLGLHQPN